MKAEKWGGEHGFYSDGCAEDALIEKAKKGNTYAFEKLMGIPVGKYFIFKYVLTSNLVKTDLPKGYAKELAGSVSIRKLLKS